MLRVLTTRQATVVTPRCFANREFGGVQAHVRFGQRKREPLVHADGPAEHDALVGVLDGPANCDLADAEGFGGDEDAFWIQAVE